MNKKKISAVFVLFFLILIGIMDFPFIARVFNQQEQTAVTVDYSSQVEDMSQAERERYLLAAIEYNYSLATGLSSGLALPFTDTTNEQQSSAYRDLLNMNEKGVMALVEIPKINVKLPIYHGTSDEVLEMGAGHMEGTSLPVGGESTHACLAAHRGLPTKKFFTDLDQMAVGDVFFIEVLGEKLAYRVYETQVVTPDIIEPLIIEEGQDLVTLITCTPYGVNTHRIYVHGVRVELDEIDEQLTGSAVAEMAVSYWWIILTFVLLGWMFILLYWFNRKPKTKKGGKNE